MSDDTASRETEDQGQAIVSLLPCPFCGGKAVLHEYKDDYGSEHIVECVDCDARITTGTRGVTIEQWNSRTATQSDKKVIVEHVVGLIILAGETVSTFGKHCVDIPEQTLVVSG